MMPVRVFHLDTGGCGACAVEVWATIELSRELQWAAGPGYADVVALTGSIMPSVREAVRALYDQYFAGRVPVVAIGRCAVDGYPFGKYGVKALDDIACVARIEACPPDPAIILEALLSAVVSRV
jgi:Ni,Fe-hydrogenase III small subunit